MRSSLPYLRHILAEECSEADSHLLTGFNKGIVNCRLQSTFRTTEEQTVLSLNGQGTYRPFGSKIIDCIFTVFAISKKLVPKLMEIIQSRSH